MDEKKRVRACNYTPEEKRALLNIIHKYKHIIENKRTDAITNNEKAKGWEKIAAEFSGISPSFQQRSVESIKKFYINKKKDVRKEVVEEKKQILLTGGGVLPSLKKDPDQDLILSIIDKSTVFGTECQFDSNSVTVVKPKKLHAKSEQILELKSNKILQETVTRKTDWKKYKPQDLKQAPSTVLQNIPEEPARKKVKKTKYDYSRRRPAVVVKALTTSELAKKYDILMDRRLEKANLQKESIQLDLELKRKKLNEGNI